MKVKILEPAKTEFELEQRVISVYTKPWDNHDGLHNVGNMAKKIGTSSSEMLRVEHKLKKEGRL